MRWRVCQRTRARDKSQPWQRGRTNYPTDIQRQQIFVASCTAESIAILLLVALLSACLQVSLSCRDCVDSPCLRHLFSGTLCPTQNQINDQSGHCRSSSRPLACHRCPLLPAAARTHPFWSSFSSTEGWREKEKRKKGDCKVQNFNISQRHQGRVTPIWLHVTDKNFPPPLSVTQS